VRDSPIAWPHVLRDAATKFHKRLCGLAQADFPEDYARYTDPTVETPYRTPRSHDIDAEIKSLALALIRCPATFRRRSGEVPSKRDLSNARGMYPSRSGLRCSPGLAYSQIISEISERLDWVGQRRPALHLLTLRHQFIDEDESHQCVWNSQQNLLDRSRQLRPLLLSIYGLGGIWNWDIAATNMKGRRGILVHLHCLIEPYLSTIESGGTKAQRQINELWFDCGRISDISDPVHLKRIRRDKADRRNAVLYVAGLKKFVDTPSGRSAKILQHYASSKQRTSGHIVVEPNRKQLRLLLAFHSFASRRIEWWIGGWSKRGLLGQLLSAAPREMVNDNGAKELL
jgi:hypothetical protein